MRQDTMEMIRDDTGPALGAAAVTRNAFKRTGYETEEGHMTLRAEKVVS